MKKEIHPNSVECTVTCACGNTFVTKSTKEAIRIDICNECHPFFTGSERQVDTAGRIEKFKKRYSMN
jgi:large subunit ribosomal protein L31